jgi:hypothetical protein
VTSSVTIRDMDHDERREQRAGGAMEPSRDRRRPQPADEHLRPAVIEELLREAGDRQHREEHHHREVLEALVGREANH